MAKNSIGLIELTSIASGFLGCDAMLKAANVDLVLSRSICSGKYMVMVRGEYWQAHSDRMETPCIIDRGVRHTPSS